MRVLMVVSAFRPLVGGAEVQAERLSEALVAEGIDVTVATARLRHLPTVETLHGVEVHRAWPVFPWRVARLAAVPLMMRAIHGLARRADVIHVHQGMEPSFAAIVVARRLGKPCIVKIGNSGARFDLDMLVRTLGRLAGKSLGRYIARHASRFVALNPEVREDLVRWDVDPGRIVAIPNGVPVLEVSDVRSRDVQRKKLGLPIDAGIIVCVGSLEAKKNHATLFRAFSNLRATSPERNVLLMVVGAGSLLPSLVHLADELGIREKVLFVGYTSSVQDYLGAADVFVLPSRTEGLSNALLEGMAVGLPCVVSDIPGNRVLIEHGVTGLLAPKDDPHTLGSCLGAVLDEPALAHRLGAAARERVLSTYSIYRVAHQYRELYDALR